MALVILILYKKHLELSLLFINQPFDNPDPVRTGSGQGKKNEHHVKSNFNSFINSIMLISSLGIPKLRDRNDLNEQLITNNKQLS